MCGKTGGRFPILVFFQGAAPSAVSPMPHRRVRNTRLDVPRSLLLGLITLDLGRARINSARGAVSSAPHATRTAITWPALACDGRCCSTAAWHEISIVSKEATPQSQCEAIAVASMRRGDTVLCLPNVVTAAELDMLVAWSTATADGIRLADGKASSDRIRMHVAPMSADPTPTSACCDAILGRVLGVIDQLLPSVVETLFNTASATNSTLASLSELHANGDLQYSAREPAINVYYAPGGEFLPHQDHHSLTVLIPLSSAAGRRGRWLFQSSFIAGAAPGPGFWGALIAC